MKRISKLNFNSRHSLPFIGLLYEYELYFLSYSTVEIQLECNDVLQSVSFKKQYVRVGKRFDLVLYVCTEGAGYNIHISRQSKVTYVAVLKWNRKVGSCARVRSYTSLVWLKITPIICKSVIAYCMKHCSLSITYSVAANTTPVQKNKFFIFHQKRQIIKQRIEIDISCCFFLN